jgi:choline dehydrogenase-like flavoprotein
LLLDAHELPDGSALSCDLCVVGAGAAGITIALELATAGMDVLLLEAGGMTAEKATQDL